MRCVAIVGSRNYPQLDRVARFVTKQLRDDDMVVSGHARGVDQTAETAARTRGLRVHSIPADWERYGKRAGYLRNEQVVAECDALVAFWDGASPGTKHAIDLARTAGKRVWVFDGTGTLIGRYNE